MYRFPCSNGGLNFVLRAETYHGSGGSWGKPPQPGAANRVLSVNASTVAPYRPIEPPQPRQPLIDARHMPRRHPPQRLIRPLEPFEMPPPPRHLRRMRTSLHEREQRLRIRPHRHVDDEQRIARRLQPRRIPALVQQPPGPSPATPPPARSPGSTPPGTAPPAHHPAPHQPPDIDLRQLPTVHARQAPYGRVVAARADIIEALIASGILP